MTMRELAKLANVSVSTVSKAFANADDVSPDTKKYIFDIAKQYGCYGKFYKGKHAKKIIAIIAPELASGYYASFVEQLQKLIEAQNCIVIVSADHFNVQKQAELVEYFTSYLKVDGIIVFDMRCRWKKGYNTPIVSLFSTADASVDNIRIDSKPAIFEAVQLLKDYGHKEIAFIGEHLTTDKSKNFRDAMESIGLNCPYVIESQYRFERAGVDGVGQLLEREADCTAIICAYDNIALGAIKELKMQGYRIPEDFSIIGMNNISVAPYMETSLSSIGVNADEVCMIAWDLLSKKIHNNFYRSNQQITLQGRLIVRESVGRVG